MLHFRKNENTNVTSYEVIARHGCANDLDHLPSDDHPPFCTEFNNKCYEFDDSTFPDAGDNVIITGIDICFCNTDR